VDDKDRRDFEIEEGTRYSVYAMLNVDTLRAIALTAILEVPFKLCSAVLVGVDLEPGKYLGQADEKKSYSFTVQCPELCGHDFEEVLEHVLRFGRLRDGLIRRRA
jgi:hypothetical protein